MRPGGESYVRAETGNGIPDFDRAIEHFHSTRDYRDRKTECKRGKRLLTWLRGLRRRYLGQLWTETNLFKLKVIRSFISHTRIFPWNFHELVGIRTLNPRLVASALLSGSTARTNPIGDEDPGYRSSITYSEVIQIILNQLVRITLLNSNRFDRRFEWSELNDLFQTHWN